MSGPVNVPKYSIVPFVSLGNHALLLPLHHRGYLGLLMCLIASTVPSVSLGSHPPTTGFALPRDFESA